MKNNEPRGFTYQLEPLQKKSDWELQNLQRDLAQCHERIDEQQQLLAQLRDQLALTTAEHLQQLGHMQTIHIERQRNTQEFLNHLAQQIKQASDELNMLEQQREQLRDALNRKLQFVDGLEQHRENEAKEYAQVLGKVQSAQADDDWLRSQVRKDLS